MANKIVIEVVSTSKGLKMTTKEIEGVDKAQPGEGSDKG